jgi:glycine/D-amino acid oxidase-like deaminating enzyme
VQKENYQIWLESVERPSYLRTQLPTETDILIIGGGITGITSAYLLSKAGKKPVLLEKRKLGEFVTSATTGFLTQVLDTEPDKLIKLFGIENAHLIFESHGNAIDDIEKIIKEEKIECEFRRCSEYIYANNRKEEKVLLKMAEDFQKLAVHAEYKKDGALKFNEFGYIEIPNQAKFNAIKYLTALAKIASNHGAIIAENTNVLSLKDENGFVLAEVENVGTIKARKVFSATYMPFAKPKYLEHKYNMYRTYIIEYKIPKNILIEGIYEDSLKPYHYLRVDSNDDSDRLIIGGADHLNILNIDHEIGANLMRDYVEKFFKADFFQEVRHWSGSIPVPTSTLAYIGESKGGNIFYAFAFNGSGLTYSYIAGKIFMDQLTGKNNPYSKIYSTDNKLPWWKNIF